MTDPLHTPTMLLKNTLNIKTPGGDNTPVERTRYFPRKLLQDCENDPPTTMISPSKFAVVRQLGSSRLRGPLEDHDTNSQDSGISDDSKSCSEFRFAEPCGAPPKRMSSIEMSPLRLRSPRTGTPDRAGFSPRVRHTRLPDKSPKRSLVFSSDSAMSLSSFSSSESMDDGFLDLFQNDKILDEDAQMSGSRLGNLLSAQILTNSTPPRSPPRRNNLFQKSLSENISPTKTDGFTLKRPLLLSSYTTDATTPLSKKHKPLSAQDLNIVPPHERGTLFQFGFKRSLAPVHTTSGLLSPPHSITPEPSSPPRVSTPSTSEHCIKLGFQRSTHEELIGDYSQPFALPLLSAKQDDLKAISSETLSKLIKGEYDSSISSFKIIDCRYPYEFEGGHIRGAVNLYRKDQISQELHSRQREKLLKIRSKKSKPVEDKREESSNTDTLAVSLPDINDTDNLINERTRSAPNSPLKGSLQDLNNSNTEGRHILVFHCEYSFERGPALYRCLRKEDRAANPYPTLTYPEVYILEGGYNAFFESHSDLCEPEAYTPMKAPEHAQDLLHFRAKSKTWSGKHQKKLSVRNLSRL